MREDNKTLRVEAFSDAVFAIAITLLVIEIKVPSHDLVAENGLTRSLFALWPSFLAFLTSFATILVIWVHHHWMFSLIKKVDHSFLYLNGFLLLFVTFLPFPTALLADYLIHPEARVAAHVYTGTILAISVAFDVLWRHASLKLLSTSAPLSSTEEAAQITRQYLYGPPLYFLSFCVSFISEAWSISMCLLVAMFFAFRIPPSNQVCIE